jgi:hypothetical protein
MSLLTFLRILDLVSARLLAYAGFDPREAIRFWESRLEAANATGPLAVASTSAPSEKPIPQPKKATVGCAILGKTDEHDWATSTASWAMGREIHPLNEERVLKLKEELRRWEVEWSRLEKKTS